VRVNPSDLCVAGDVTATRGWCLASEIGHSHRRMSEALRGGIGGLLKEKCVDFGATLAAEELSELDGVKVSAETVRRMQIGLGLWRPKTRRVFQLRGRRLRFDELVCRSMAVRTTASKAGGRAAR